MNDNMFAYDCDCVLTSGNLVALKQKQKEVNNLSIYVEMTLPSTHSIWFTTCNTFYANFI